MILYVDETENEEFFIVTGLLVSSKEDINLAYKQFKKKISKFKLSEKTKQKIFMEFKAKDIDRHFQRIKYCLLETLSNINNSVIYSCYVKKEDVLKQSKKEDVYIALLSNIVKELDSETDIVFDTFNKPRFEERIVNTIKLFFNVKNVESKDSQADEGIKFVDNICSVIRLKKSNLDTCNYYEYIKKNIREV